MGYRFPLKLNGIPREPFDIGGREAAAVPTHVWEGVVYMLGSAADVDAIRRKLSPTATGAMHAWLTPAAPGSPGRFIVHVETPHGATAELGPLNVDPEGFAAAGRSSHFDGEAGHVRHAFVHRTGPQPVDDSIEFTGPHSVPVLPPGPETITIRVERQGEPERVEEVVVQRFDDETRQAVIERAARLAGGVLDHEQTPPYRTWPGHGRVLTVQVPHGRGSGGLARFTTPARLERSAQEG